jgi:hypothetical protein
LSIDSPQTQLYGQNPYDGLRGAARLGFGFSNGGGATSVAHIAKTHFRHIYFKSK